MKPLADRIAACLESCERTFGAPLDDEVEDGSPIQLLTEALAYIRANDARQAAEVQP